MGAFREGSEPPATRRRTLRDRPVNVLFVCEDNCALSIMAESILRSVAGNRFGAYSAGCASREALGSDVLEFLSGHHMPIDGLHAKTLAAMRTHSAPRMDFIITLCESAAKQDFSSWPGHPFVANWNVCDEEQDPDMRAELRDYFWTLMRRIKIFASLPHGKLSRRALEQRVLTLQPSYL
jgi:protein-tyrosine-phosphatase